MKLNPEVKNIFDFTYEDFELLNYDPHPLIKGKSCNLSFKSLSVVTKLIKS